MKLKLVNLLIIAGALLLSGCVENKDETIQKSIGDSQESPFAVFDPAPEHNSAENILIPIPSDVAAAALAGGAISLPDNVGYENPLKGIATLDGFSTTSPITTKFSEAIDTNSVSDVLCAQDCPVMVYELQQTGPVALNYGLDYVVRVPSYDAKTLAIVPLKPLKGSTKYLVVVKKGIQSTNQQAFLADFAYAIAKNPDPIATGIDPTAEDFAITLPALQSYPGTTVAQLEQLRRSVSTVEGLITAVDTSLSRSSIILSWTFTTQSIGKVLRAKRDEIYGGGLPKACVSENLPCSPVLVNYFDEVNPDNNNENYDIYKGVLPIDYYLSVNPENSGPKNGDRDDAGNYIAFERPSPTLLQIPLVVFVPTNTQKPVAGWRTIIFQHGITGSRAEAEIFANRLFEEISSKFPDAGPQFAIVAIDLPLHGLPAGDRLRVTLGETPVPERHFEIPVPEGVEQSGALYINPFNLLVTRDNVRQSVVDLMRLTKSLKVMDYDGDMAADFNENEIYFVGHSLGGIVGSTFTALDAEAGENSLVRASVISSASGGIAKMVEASIVSKPIKAGLAAREKPILPNTREYETYWSGVQTIIDTADPINFAGGHLESNLLAIKINDDRVIPNAVLGAPLSGSNPLYAFFGLSSVELGAPQTRGVLALDGHHISIYTPFDVNKDSENREILPVSETSRAAYDGIYQAVGEFLNTISPFPIPQPL